MASINKLSVRGIRSFSPDDVEQVVEFYFPFTIIVGANGCGKTTIIESLKYAVTGGFPPGTRSGQSFVHDARSIGQNKVKANVKLRFTSRSGQSMVVVRSMEVTQAKAKATFKQLDGVLRMIDPDTGEKVSLSHKCSELDKQIPNLLGVSGPILEHVIFCHQEDSSWPLQDAALLKKKFDEIFDSTRYSKALDLFRKTEKEMLAQVKDLKADLAGLKSHKHAAEVFRKEFAEQNEQIENVDEMKKEISTKILKAEEDIKKLKDTINQLEEVENLLESNRNHEANEHLIIQKQKNMLEEDLTSRYSVLELKDMYSDFDEKVGDIVNHKNQLMKHCQKLQTEMNELRAEEMKLTSQIGRYTAEKDAHEKRLRERYDKMVAIALKYSVDLNMSQMSQQTISQQQLANDDSEDDGTTIADRSKPSDNSTILLMSSKDMDSFFAALEKKEIELKQNLKLHRERFQAEEDKIQSELTEIGGKLKATESERGKLIDERTETTRELNDLSSQLVGHSRLRKADVEEARRNAENFAKKLQDANADPRRAQIPIDIRNVENETDLIRRQLEDDKLTLESLRYSADAQNEISVLKEQCEKDFHQLEETLNGRSLEFKKYNIQGVASLPRNDDDDGTEILSVIESMETAVRAKYDDRAVQLNKASNEVAVTRRNLSEKKATFASCQKTLTSHKAKLSTLTQSVAEVKNAIDDLRRHEAQRGLSVPGSIEMPKELLAYVDSRLEEVEEDEPNSNSPKVVRKLMKRLKKLSVIPNEVENQFFCPCCTREMITNEEVAAFAKAINEIVDTLATPNETEENYHKLKFFYQQFRKLLSDKMEDLRDFQRLTEESSDIEKEGGRLEDDIEIFESTLLKQEGVESDVQLELNELRDLVDLARRWSEDATRIAEKRMQIQQKNQNLTASVVDSSRDLRTVEREMNDLMEKKDIFTTKINRLNKEMTQLNNAVSTLSIQVSQSEKNAREKEAKYASEQKATERKSALMERVQQIGDEEKKLQDLIAPLKNKVRSKEVDKQRMRSAANETERILQTEVSQFDGELKQLRDIVQHIDSYTKSNKSDELQRLSSEIRDVLGRMDERKQKLLDAQPELESAKSAELDQDRHKKNLQQNIDIMESTVRIKDIKKDIARLELKRKSIEGYDTVYNEFETVKNSKEKMQEDKARLDGRFSEIAESIRSTKRKLSAPEYKNVDEEYRVATIKHTTTQIAADDLKKYAAALDQALLQFHSVKIGEINKIIRELWLLTYKGEDINNIEIVSGQEAGSRAAKSYNYRVVMTKGNTQMDMRGRCSAGQRVLASIVIRLALAETFGINCGCIALDEPTVNLDYENKKGLGIALAQIIASRSQQRNFQLILITHDEEFVSMMKTELASLTGFSMPEKYFQVSREQAPDGKFYSKIHSVDLDELV